MRSRDDDHEIGADDCGRWTSYLRDLAFFLHSYCMGLNGWDGGQIAFDLLQEDIFLDGVF